MTAAAPIPEKTRAQKPVERFPGRGWTLSTPGIESLDNLAPRIENPCLSLSAKRGKCGPRPDLPPEAHSPLILRW